MTQQDGRTVDYQLALDPFRDPDLFDVFDEPSQRLPTPQDYELNDGMPWISA